MCRIVFSMVSQLAKKCLSKELYLISTATTTVLILLSQYIDDEAFLTSFHSYLY